MSATATMSKTVSLGGKTFTHAKTLTGDGAIILEKSVAAAKTGEIQNWTDADTAEILAASGHGITTGQIVDVFWDLAGVPQARYGLTVGTVASLVVPVDGGTGDDLPANATEVTVQVQNTDAFLFDGDNLEALVISVEGKAIVSFFDAGGIEYTHVFHEAGLYEWHDGLDEVNPLAGDDVITVKYTNGESSGAKTVKIGALYN